MKWENVIDMSSVTVADCLRFYDRGLITVINDGIVVDFVKEQ